MPLNSARHFLCMACSILRRVQVFFLFCAILSTFVFPKLPFAWMCCAFLSIYTFYSFLCVKSLILEADIAKYFTWHWQGSKAARNFFVHAIYPHSSLLLFHRLHTSIYSHFSTPFVLLYYYIFLICPRDPFPFRLSAIASSDVCEHRECALVLAAARKRAAIFTQFAIVLARR